MDAKTIRTVYDFGDAARGIALDATITPRTFAALVRDAEPAKRPPDHGGDALGEGGTITIPLLPRIAIASAEGEPYRAEPGAHREAERADFELLGVLGEGGMGRVLRVRQRSLGRDVAVKQVKPGVSDASAESALLREALITGSLEHPSIVPVHALGHDDEGRPLLVMKRIEGVAWSELAADEEHPAWERLPTGAGDRMGAHIEIVMLVCNAIHFAHRRGVIHRDIKPANVMVGEFGEVYLVDWGLAARLGDEAPDPSSNGAAGERGDEPPRAPWSARRKVDSIRPLVGTPRFMAPEMVSGDPHRIDARTDVYLLGATLHTVLTGRPRHAGRTLVDVLVAANASLPYPYDGEIPEELAHICNKATSASPAERYPTALAFRQALADYLRHRSSVALSARALERLRDLRARLAAEASASGDGALEIQRVATECRFGFGEALREWPENPAARSGLASCYEAVIEREIALRDPRAARGLLAQLPEPRADLEARVAALEDELRRDREQQAELVRMARDHDPTVAEGPRSRFLWVICALGLAISVVVWQRGARSLTHAEMLRIELVITGVLLAAVAVCWRRLLQGAVNRRLVLLVLTWNCTTLANRAIGAWVNAPVGVTLSTDLLLLALFAAAGAIFLLRQVVVVVPICLVGAVLAARWPEASLPAFVAATCCLAAVIVRARPRAAGAERRKDA